MVEKPRLPLTLSAIAAVLALVAALAGVLDPAIYLPMTPEAMVPGAVSQDVLSLVVAAALIVLLPALARGAQPRLWAVWLGLMGYLAYAYALYAFDTIVNRFFLVYVAILAASLWSVVAFFARSDRAALRAVSPPRRVTAGLFAVLIALFSALWLSILIPAMQARDAPNAPTIFVLDFAIVLPALGFGAIMLWRAAPWGDLLALPLLVKAGTLGISVLFGALLAPAFGRPMVATEIAVYAILGILPLTLTIPWWRALAP